MDTSNTIIETKNLFLKGITLNFAEDVFREFTPEITTFMFPKPAEKIEETIKFITDSKKKNEEGSNLQIVILDKTNNEFLGCGGLHHLDTKTPELGIWIKKSAHGHGFGKEAVIALKEWADQNLNYEYLLYPVAEENYPSRRIPEFLGGKIARKFKHTNASNSGVELNFVEYRIYPQK